MPIYEYLCTDCGNLFEILVSSRSEKIRCSSCGSQKVKKMLSATAAYSGGSRDRMPGPGDTACCGSNPGHAGFAGPGSCCGKAHG